MATRHPIGDATTHFERRFRTSAGHVRIYLPVEHSGTGVVVQRKHRWQFLLKQQLALFDGLPLDFQLTWLESSDMPPAALVDTLRSRIAISLRDRMPDRPELHVVLA